MPKIEHKFKKNLFLLILTDIVLLAISYGGSYLLRFDLKIPPLPYLASLKYTLIPFIGIKIFIFYQFHLYQGMWRYTGLKDLENLIKASLVSSGFMVLLTFAAVRFRGFARSVFLIDSLLTIFLIGGCRLGIRLFFSSWKKETLPWMRNGDGGSGHKKRKKVLIVGAGDAGEKILREINDNRDLVHYEVVGFLDDNPRKIHRHIHGIKVLDGIENVASVVRNIDVDEIMIAIPSASAEQMRRIIDLCQQTGVNCKTIPTIGELLNDKVSISAIRDVSYADLLGRSQIELDIERIGAYLKDKCILVTGAAGSIGSELCRQIMAFEPRALIMMDRAESSLYEIEMELRHLYPRQILVPALGSVTCRDSLKGIFNRYHPQVVFHAAAYKHVPMMEIHPWEAVFNNILGTSNVLEAALEARAERFVLVSTDKAVRPTNVMGASKRVAEIILQLKHEESARAAAGQRKLAGTKIMAVRFGNVIGSAGSVIPLFKRQIAYGGPVTVTHPEVTRYFMTIGEAVQLILQAGAMGESGDIYILKMGRPIRILDMARDLIRLSGFIPDKDIRIEITGLRPGEKLYEELITEGEGIVPTSHDKLMVLRSNGQKSAISARELKEKIEELLSLAQRQDGRGIQLKLQEIVPEYHPQILWDKVQFQCEKIVDLQSGDEIIFRANNAPTLPV
ncbi:MAG: polysaccharide biosynthesis protein [bacterium]|nr:polysaccharide biosynthesis protein [bacterium]